MLRDERGKKEGKRHNRILGEMEFGGRRERERERGRERESETERERERERKREKKKREEERERERERERVSVREKRREKRRERKEEKEREKERDNLVYLYRISGSESLRKSSKYEEGVRLIRLSTSSPSNHLYKRSL